MPAIRTASSSKGKTSPGVESDADNEEPLKKVKALSRRKPSAAKATSQTSIPHNGMPTNTKLPVSISFPARPEGSTRLVAWNVCGLASAMKKGFKLYVEGEDPDVLVLTETKVNNVSIDPFLSNKYPYRYWSISDQKGYAGTAVLSKVAPLDTSMNIPGYDAPDVVKGRIVTLEFKTLFVVGTYVPNAGEKLKNMERKKAWNEAFEAYIRSMDAKKPIIWLGDLNVVPTALDIKNDKANWNKSAGYTEIEVNAFKRTLAPSPSISGSQRLVDVWRERHPDDEHYTYFSYRFQTRAKQTGWRLDFFILSERLLPRVQQCEIRHEIYGASDHLPIMMDLEGAL